MHFWRDICEDVDTRPTYLVGIVQRDYSNLEYCDPLGVRTGVVWVDPNEDGVRRVWQFQWSD